MKKLLIIISLAFTSFLAKAQINNVDAVQNTIKEMFETLSSLNTDKMKTFFTSEAVILESGSLWNVDTLVMKINARKNIADFKRTNTFDFKDIKIDGNIAWVYYYLQATGVSNGRAFKVRWLESAVLVKDISVWKIKLLHSTVLESS